MPTVGPRHTIAAGIGVMDVCRASVNHSWPHLAEQEFPRRVMQITGVGIVLGANERDRLVDLGVHLGQVAGINRALWRRDAWLGVTAPVGLAGDDHGEAVFIRG